MKTQELIKSIIAESGEHLSAEQIYLEAKKREAKLSLATLYRNLAAMIDSGEIGTVAVDTGVAHYDKTSVSHPHLHCTRCGEIYDIEAEKINRVLKEQFLSDNFTYQLVVRGVCKKCAAGSVNQ